MKKIKDHYKGIELPAFLYEDDGEVKIGRHGDSICTEEWIEWIERIEAILTEAKLKKQLL